MGSTGSPRPVVASLAPSTRPGHRPPGVPVFAADGRVAEPPAGQRRLLWIDDRLTPGDAACRLMTSEGFHVEVARTGEAGLRAARAGTFDALLVDVNLPDILGTTVTLRLLRQGVSVPIIGATAFAEPELADTLLELGAVAVIHFPLIDIERTAATVRSILDDHADVPAEPPLGVLCASEPMRAVMAWVERIAPSKGSVILTGETGTGKECVARAIHEASGRTGEFVAVNCSAIQETLFESELFGHQRGAFTGAAMDRPGLAVAAAGGTLFLDEIGELPLALQARLLRFLDDRRVRRLGDNTERAVDVRVVAATNRRLDREVAARRFREDLYYRFMLKCEVPALRERPDDVEVLARYLLHRIASQDRGRRMTLAPSGVGLLRRPGNVRELNNIIQTAVCMASTPVLTDLEIGEALRGFGEAAPLVSGDGVRGRILGALRACRGNHTDAAKALRIGRTTLWRRMRDLGIFGDEHA